MAKSFYQQNERGTWFHLRFGSSHELDHVLLRKDDRWSLKSSRALHRGARRAQNRGGETRVERTIMPEKITREDGVIAWGAYTDHEPVEVEIRCRMQWQGGPDREPENKGTPDWTRMLGPRAEEKKGGVRKEDGRKDPRQ